MLSFNPLRNTQAYHAYNNITYVFTTFYNYLKNKFRAAVANQVVAASGTAIRNAAASSYAAVASAAAALDPHIRIGDLFNSTIVLPRVANSQIYVAGVCVPFNNWFVHNGPYPSMLNGVPVAAPNPRPAAPNLRPFVAGEATMKKEYYYCNARVPLNSHPTLYVVDRIKNLSVTVWQVYEDYTDAYVSELLTLINTDLLAIVRDGEATFYKSGASAPPTQEFVRALRVNFHRFDVAAFITLVVSGFVDVGFAINSETPLSTLGLVLVPLLLDSTGKFDNRVLQEVLLFLKASGIKNSPGTVSQQIFSLVISYFDSVHTDQFLTGFAYAALRNGLPEVVSYSNELTSRHGVSVYQDTSMKWRLSKPPQPTVLAAVGFICSSYYFAPRVVDEAAYDHVSHPEMVQLSRLITAVEDKSPLQVDLIIYYNELLSKLSLPDQRRVFTAFDQEVSLGELLVENNVLQMKRTDPRWFLSAANDSDDDEDLIGEAAGAKRVMKPLFGGTAIPKIDNEATRFSKEQREKSRWAVVDRIAEMDGVTKAFNKQEIENLKANLKLLPHLDEKAMKTMLGGEEVRQLLSKFHAPDHFLKNVAPPLLRLMNDRDAIALAASGKMGVVKSNWDSAHIMDNNERGHRNDASVANTRNSAFADKRGGAVIDAAFHQIRESLGRSHHGSKRARFTRELKTFKIALPSSGNHHDKPEAPNPKITYSGDAEEVEAPDTLAQDDELVETHALAFHKAVVALDCALDLERAPELHLEAFRSIDVTEVAKLPAVFSVYLGDFKNNGTFVTFHTGQQKVSGLLVTLDIFDGSQDCGDHDSLQKHLSKFHNQKMRVVGTYKSEKTGATVQHDQCYSLDNAEIYADFQINARTLVGAAVVLIPTPSNLKLTPLKRLPASAFAGSLISVGVVKPDKATICVAAQTADGPAFLSHSCFSQPGDCGSPLFFGDSIIAVHVLKKSFGGADRISLNFAYSPNVREMKKYTPVTVAMQRLHQPVSLKMVEVYEKIDEAHTQVQVPSTTLSFPAPFTFVRAPTPVGESKVAITGFTGAGFTTHEGGTASATMEEDKARVPHPLREGGAEVVAHTVQVMSDVTSAMFAIAAENGYHHLHSLYRRSSIAQRNRLILFVCTLLAGPTSPGFLYSTYAVSKPTTNKKTKRTFFQDVLDNPDNAKIVEQFCTHVREIYSFQDSSWQVGARTDAPVMMFSKVEAMKDDKLLRPASRTIKEPLFHLTVLQHLHSIQVHKDSGLEKLLAAPEQEFFNRIRTALGGAPALPPTDAVPLPVLTVDSLMFNTGPMGAWGKDGKALHSCGVGCDLIKLVRARPPRAGHSYYSLDVSSWDKTLPVEITRGVFKSFIVGPKKLAAFLHDCCNTTGRLVSNGQAFPMNAASWCSGNQFTLSGNSIAHYALNIAFTHSFTQAKQQKNANDDDSNSVVEVVLPGFSYLVQGDDAVLELPASSANASDEIRSFYASIGMAAKHVRPEADSYDYCKFYNRGGKVYFDVFSSFMKGYLNKGADEESIIALCATVDGVIEFEEPADLSPEAKWFLNLVRGFHHHTTLVTRGKYTRDDSASIGVMKVESA